MKPSTVMAATAALASGAVIGGLLVSNAASQPRSLDAAVYTPIGVVQSPNGAHTMAWLLDATNRRVVMCFQRLNEPSTARIECRTGDLPSP
jgi:hypothetical protein